MPTLSAQARSTLAHSANATLSSLRCLPSTVSSTAQSLPEKYSTYVAHNSSSISQIESALRSLTYLLPGARLHDSELASESLHTFIQLLSVYHDHLLKTRAELLKKSQTISKYLATKPTPRFRYTDFWSKTSPLYTRVATVLKIIQYTELLWEMIARRRGGEKARWRVVVLLEAFKAFCKLILLRLTGSRPLVHPPLPIREEFAPKEEDESDTDPDLDRLADDELEHVDPIPVPETDFTSANPQPNVRPIPPHSATGGIPTPPLSEPDNKPENTPPHSPPTPWQMPRTNHPLPPLPATSHPSITTYLLSHAISATDLKPAPHLLPRLTTLPALAAELLYILRPLIYAILLQRAANQSRSNNPKAWRTAWSPWLLGFGADYAAHLLAAAYSPSYSPNAHTRSSSPLAHDTSSSRFASLAWWGMRGPFYEAVTKQVIGAGRRSVKKVPVVGELLGGVVEDYEWLWGEWYFSTSS